MPNDIGEKASLAQLADKNGKPWREVFREAMATYEQGIVPADEVDIDEEIRAELVGIQQAAREAIRSPGLARPRAPVWW